MEDFNKFLLDYFKRELADGKHEFRLVARLVTENTVELMIHPNGKDGETIDLQLAREQSHYYTLGKKS